MTTYSKRRSDCANFNISQKLKQFYEDSKHVISVSYKPDMSTFRRTLKIVLFGTLLVGVLAYVIYIVMSLIT
ncbi:MAG: protein translocase SEC61 complex subunit gamma [Candidatus Micrarchaeaceae archaeon]